MTPAPPPAAVPGLVFVGACVLLLVLVAALIIVRR